MHKEQKCIVPSRLLPEGDLHLRLEDEHNAVNQSLPGQLRGFRMPDPLRTVIVILSVWLHCLLHNTNKFWTQL